MGQPLSLYRVLLGPLPPPPVDPQGKRLVERLLGNVVKLIGRSATMTYSMYPMYRFFSPRAFHLCLRRHLYYQKVHHQLQYFMLN